RDGAGHAQHRNPRRPVRAPGQGGVGGRPFPCPPAGMGGRRRTRPADPATAAPAPTVPPVMTAPATDAVPPARQALQATSARSGAPGRCGQGAGGWPMTFSRANAAYDRAQSLMKQSQELLAVAQILAQARTDRRHALLHGQPSRAPRDLLRQSEYLRLQARLETMPVIEQAKGILMAQSRCGSDDEAFDLLRRASQRSN